MTSYIIHYPQINPRGIADRFDNKERAIDRLNKIKSKLLTEISSIDEQLRALEA